MVCGKKEKRVRQSVEGCDVYGISMGYGFWGCTIKGYKEEKKEREGQK